MANVKPIYQRVLVKLAAQAMIFNKTQVMLTIIYAFFNVLHKATNVYYFLVYYAFHVARVILLYQIKQTIIA